MSAKRTDMHRLQELLRLHRMGTPVRTITRTLRMSPKTERKYRLILQDAGLLEGDPDDIPELDVIKGIIHKAMPPSPPKQEVSTAAPYREQISRMMDQGARPKAIFDYLKLHVEGFDVSYQAIKRLCRSIRKQRGVQPQDVVIPVVTRPGLVAQIDFGYVGMLFDPCSGQVRKAWVFVMVLGHSRHMFAKIVFDQRIETWLQLHVDAFEFFGAVP